MAKATRERCSLSLYAVLCGVIQNMFSTVFSTECVLLAYTVFSTVFSKAVYRMCSLRCSTECVLLAYTVFSTVFYRMCSLQSSTECVLLAYTVFSTVFSPVIYRMYSLIPCYAHSPRQQWQGLSFVFSSVIREHIRIPCKPHWPRQQWQGRDVLLAAPRKQKYSKVSALVYSVCKVTV